MHTLQRSEESAQPHPGPTWEYRAATIEEAVEAAANDLGSDIEIITANRIRRGGVGGFFATDLGVEVVVARLEPGKRSIPARRGAAARAGNGGDALQAFLDTENTADATADGDGGGNDGLDRLLAVCIGQRLQAFAVVEVVVGSVARAQPEHLPRVET